MCSQWLLSKVCSLGCGVPQGTILGPLLFLIYINDFPNCLSSCQPRMYAEDTLITYARADLHSKQSSLNRDLSNIHKWLLCNKLTLNSTKTEFMLIGSRQTLSTLSESLELSIDNIPIKQVSTIINENPKWISNMAWHSHIDKLSKKIASNSGAIKQIRPFVSPELLHYIYNALVQTHFDYCGIVWGKYGKMLSEKLQKLQNSAARINYEFLLLWCWHSLLVTTTWLERPDHPASNSSSFKGVQSSQWSGSWLCILYVY